MNPSQPIELDQTQTASDRVNQEPEAPEARDAGLVSSELLAKMDAYWRAANYLSVGQIYLLDNPLLREPLQRGQIKPRLLGHWGTSPGLNLIYVHLNRIIKEHDLNVLFVTGPGHGGPSLVAHAYLEGTYSEVYPTISQNEAGMQRLFKQFSFPGGIPSHVAPETPGSINEGGELGYALSHAFGAAFDNPDLIVAAVVGDGEAETGPLATSWHSNKFLNPVTDGAVLPILHLNGYKIASPTILARIPKDELQKLFEGYGYKPYFVEGYEPNLVHQELAAVMDTITAEIHQIWHDARTRGIPGRPIWPMIILRTPKGWTCPAEIDGRKCEDYWRSHQVPMGDMDKLGHVEILQQWMQSYRPDELFDEAGRLMPEIAELAPQGTRRMSANPHANGGLLLEDLTLPNFRDYAVLIASPGVTVAEATREMGKFLRDVMRFNLASKNFRIVSPDENNSNRWQDVLEVTNRTWMAEWYDTDDKLSPDGRVMEMLSEHQCQGWLEGYLLTGRHGFFSCYEAFIHIIDSMFNQHAKWLKVCNHIPWRAPIASLNYLLSSHVWRQDHNGFSHQDPGFLDHVANKKAEVIRIYLPPDANTLLSVTDHCLRSRNRVNVVVAGKQPSPQWLSIEEAVNHCANGLGIWTWASNDGGEKPDVVMACCGDVPTIETLAAVELLRQHLPDLKVRVINVVNLMKLQPPSEHPNGLSDDEFDAMFTTDQKIIFAFHGYPSLIHQLTYRRTNHKNLHVRGFKEEGTTTTPFDMVVLNDMDRFHLVCDVIDRVPGLAERAAVVRQAMVDKRAEHKRYINEHGIDMPEILHWKWKRGSDLSQPDQHDRTDQSAIARWNSVALNAFGDSSREIVAAANKEIAIERWENEGGEIVNKPKGRTDPSSKVQARVKRLIVFDLDGTLAPSKAAVDAEMVELLNALLRRVKVAVISGGDWPQFQSQLIANLSADTKLENLSLLPTSGTSFYRYNSAWKHIYADDFGDEEKEKIIRSLKEAVGTKASEIKETWGEQIEDRGSQITFSALGQLAPLEQKEQWDPDFTKRKKIQALLANSIPEFTVRLGGTTSIDVTKLGIDKAYGIEKLRELLAIELDEMLFVGDALFPGGNDYPVKQAGVTSIQVANAEETKRVIETLLASMNGDQPSPLCEKETAR